MSESEGAMDIPTDSPRIGIRRKIAIDQPLSPPIQSIASPTTPRYLGLLASILLAIIAQYVLIVLPEKSLPQILSAEVLKRMWPHPASVVVAIVLYVGSILLFVRSVRPRLDDGHRTLLPRTATGSWPIEPRAFVVVIVGVLLQIWVDVRLATAPYDPAEPRWFAVSLVLILGALAWNERREIVGRLPKSVRISILLEVAYVTGLTGAFIWLDWFDLRNWFFSAIGDEYAFINMARELTKGEVRNLFSQHGAFDIIPLMSSYVASLGMRVLGVNLVGWKMSLVLEIALALVLTYQLARTLFGRRAAILTLGFLATSHYLLAYTHTGYDNIETLLPAVGSFLLFIVGLRRTSLFILILSGVCAGLGWYTFYPSRTAIVIVGIVLLLSVTRPMWFKIGLPVVGGFAMMFLPLLAASKLEVFTAMLDQTAGGSRNEAIADKILLPLWNIGRSLAAFNYNTHKGPYLLGSLLEPVTAIFFVLGLGLVIARWRDARYRFLLIWYVIGLIATGVISRYDYVTVSRLNYLLPLTAILAALAVDHLLASVWPSRSRNDLGVKYRSTWSAFRTERMATVGVVVIVAFSTYGNLHRWFVEMPAEVPSTPDALVIKEVELSRCQSAPKAPLVVETGIPGVLGTAFDAMSPPIIRPEYALYKDPAAWMKTASSRCVIFRSPRTPEALTLIKQFNELWPTAESFEDTDPSGETHVHVFLPTKQG